MTGTGTMFATAAFRPGDTLQIQNLTAIIASVDSNTSLILTEPWTGTSLTNAPYRARYLPDGARVTAQTTTLIELLGNGVLSNIASVPVEDGNLLVGNASGQYEPISKDELGIQDPNGSVASLAELVLAARQILQTDASGDLKQVALAANKALATDANGDVAPIDLGTLGRALLALATGTNAQYVRGDGQLATLNKAAVGLGNVDNTSDASKPISTAQQAALNGKAGFGYNVFTDNQEIRKGIPRLYFISPSATYGYRMEANISDTVNGSWRVGAGYAGPVLLECFADNRVVVPGTLSKGGGTFLIDHPLFSLYKTKNLRHGFVESTEYLNIYRGEVRLVNGRATVNIDEFFGMTVGTFWALNADITVSSLQNQESFDRLKPGAALDSGTFEIVCENENSNDLVAWMVTGRRKDPFVLHLDPNCERGTGKLIPEFDKPDYVENANG
ncbi:hypothetical protein L3V16_15315 [Brucella ciceri]|uniref:hypothetical protein n=1 Tax=Brucella ciceri TaxID=391287 RepID=UPI001F146583|nr:hypothetical protein [Brucella ciceri]MCH6205206.1 hypothetical protein [Brucella ciceri]